MPFKLKSPHVSLNAPNVKFKRFMTHTRVVPWDWSVHRMFSEGVPNNSRHLVFNCHGFAWRKEFQAPHLSLGTVLHPGNVSAFSILAGMQQLLVIWISSCVIASSKDGLDFCKDMARNSGCYVVSQLFAAPDVPLPQGQTDDNKNAMPVYIDPFGDPISRTDFLARGQGLGFALI